MAYGVVCLASFFVNSPLGENIARVRFAALPIAVLVLSLRGWRPIRLRAVALLLAASWNLSPHAWSFPAARASSLPPTWRTGSPRSSS